MDWLRRLLGATKRENELSSQLRDAEAFRKSEANESDELVAENKSLRAELGVQRELLRLTVEGARDVEKQMAVAEKDRQEAITSAVHWRTLAAALRAVNADLDAKLNRLQAGQESDESQSEPAAWCPAPAARWPPADASVVGGVDFGSSWPPARLSGPDKWMIDRLNSTQEQGNAD